MDSSLLGSWLLWRVWRSICCNRREKGRRLLLCSPHFSLFGLGGLGLFDVFIFIFIYFHFYVSGWIVSVWASYDFAIHSEI